MTSTQFFRAALRDYHIGAVTKSSSYVVQRVAAAVPVSCRTIVEYGPGDGVTTRGLLARCVSPATIFAIEKTADFLPELRNIDDVRLTVHHGDILAEAPKLRERFPDGVDAVVSNVPLTFFSPEHRDGITRATAAALRPGGRFVVYQYSPLMRSVLARHFRRVHISYEPRNFPPYFIMVAER